MKWIARFFYLFLLLAVISMPVYLDKESDGQFLGLDMMMTKLSELPQKAMNMFKGEAAPEITTEAGISQTAEGAQYFRWQDENGVWQFSEEKPEGIDVEAAQTGPVMTVPALEPKASTAAQGPNAKLTQMHVDPLSVESAVNVMENAKSAAAMMEQRQQALREIVGEE